MQCRETALSEAWEAMRAAAFASPQSTPLLMAEEQVHFESSAPLLPSLRAVKASVLDKAAKLHSMPALWRRAIRSRGADQELRLSLIHI